MNVEQLAIALEIEKERVKEVREILTTNHKAELKGKINRIKNAVIMEVEEALICLDRDDPNVNMAINRLRDIQQLLKKFN